MTIGEKQLYYWAWWANVDPATGRINKGCWGYKESESELITEMSKRGKSRNDYEIYATPHYGESQVKHEINDLISAKTRNIDRAIQARYKSPVERR